MDNLRRGFKIVIMVKDYYFKDPEGVEKLRGTVSFTKALYLEATHERPVEIYGLSEECPNFVWGNNTSHFGKVDFTKPFNVTVTIALYGVWKNPDSWFGEGHYLCITQECEDGTLTTLYDGPFVSGCTGDVYSRTKGLFTEMGFVCRPFKKDIDAFLEEITDEWILL